MSVSSILPSSGYTFGGLSTAALRATLCIGSIDLIKRYGPELKPGRYHVKTDKSKGPHRYFINPSFLFGVICGCAQNILNGMRSKH